MQYGVPILTVVLHCTLDHTEYAQVLADVHQYKVLWAPHSLICPEPRTLLGRLILGFFISVNIIRAIPRNSNFPRQPRFCQWWCFHEPDSPLAAIKSAAQVRHSYRVQRTCLTFWSSRFDYNRGLEGFYRPHMRYNQLQLTCNFAFNSVNTQQESGRQGNKERSVGQNKHKTALMTLTATRRRAILRKLTVEQARIWILRDYQTVLAVLRYDAMWLPTFRKNL